MESTPDDRLDIMEARDPVDSPKDARCEDQRALRIPAALDDPQSNSDTTKMGPGGFRSELLPTTFPIVLSDIQTDNRDDE